MRIIAVVLLCVGLVAQSDVAFRIAEPDLIPEGIAHDSKTRTFFVGSTFKRKIVAVDASGKSRDFTKEGQDGVFGFVGLRVDAPRRTLWALSANAGGTMPARGLDKSCLGCSTVTRYNIDSGKLLKKYELSNKPSVHFLNDLVVTPAGDVFITDTMSGDIYRITRAKDVLEPWASLGPRTYPNGIDSTPDGRTLFVATEQGLRRIDAATGAVATLPGPKTPSIDGLYFFRDSLIAIQPFEEYRKVMRYSLSPGHDAVTNAEIIEKEHPLFRQPTTGVIVGSDFYYIANAQLQLFRAMYKDGAYDRSALADVAILRKPLAGR